jgi:hypothetical protein
MVKVGELMECPRNLIASITAETLKRCERVLLARQRSTTARNPLTHRQLPE